MGKECHFSLITLFDPNIVVSPADVHDYELSASAEVVNNLGNERGYVPVLFCPFIYGSIILYWS